MLYLNEKLFRFKKISCPLCSFCQSKNEAPIHLFHACNKTYLLWYKSKKFLKTKIDLPVNTPQSAIFGFLNYENNSDIIYCLLLIFKYYLFNSREHKKFRLEVLKKKIVKIYIVNSANTCAASWTGKICAPKFCGKYEWKKPKQASQ